MSSRRSGVGARVTSRPPAGDASSTLDDPCETSLFAALVRSAVETLTPRAVLDVGCGCGIPTIEAARAGASRVVGIDVVARNVEIARNNIRCAALEDRVSAVEASWQDVQRGRCQVGPVDLVVANPPYVPCGRGVAVDGGPRGTTLLNEIVDGLSPTTHGLALLFGSLSDPLALLGRIAARGFVARRLLARSVSFGRYTSHPSTLAALRALRRSGHAWFRDAPSVDGFAPHAYLTLGLVAERPRGSRLGATASQERLRIALARMLAAYQRGPRTR